MDAPGPPSRAAAFFDFDKTLLHGDAGVIFGRTLLEWGFAQGRALENPVGKARRYAAISAQVAATLGKGLAYRSLNAVGLMKRSALIERSYRFLKGLPAEEMRERMERVWTEKIQQRLYPRMKEVIEDHRKAGRRIVIVTTGMRELVEHARKALGEDIDVLGVEMLQDEHGAWLGEVEGPLYGVHKAEAVLAYAKQHDLDLAASYAYSDHYSDAAFLAVVGHPVAVNPQMRLSLLARRKGWEVLWVLPPPRHPSRTA